jgi:biopolymer transport protein ExbD
MRLVGPRANVQLDTMPLLGVALVLLVVMVVAVMPRPRQLPVDLPTVWLDDHHFGWTRQPVDVRLRADMTARVSSDAGLQVVPVTDLARTVHRLLRAERTGFPELVYVDFDDDVAWDDAVAVVDTLRALNRADRPISLVLHHAEAHEQIRFRR